MLGETGPAKALFPTPRRPPPPQSTGDVSSPLRSRISCSRGEGPGRTITWSNATEDLSESDGNRQQHVRWALVPDTVELVREAFAAWEAVTDLDFREVADGPDSDIRIGLTGGGDSTGGILAYTTSWSQGADAVESVIAVDFDAVAQLDRTGSWTPTHIYNIALHEIGHAIGLDDSQVRDAVMHSAYDVSTTTRLALHQDDLDGVKAIYSRSNRGSSSPPAPVPSAPVVPLGDLSVQPGPAGGSGTVEGNGQDYFSFDLTASSGVRFELRNLTADADLYLLSVEDSSTTVLAQSVRAGTAVDTITRTLGAGSYYVRIDAYADGPVDYQLHVTTPPADGQTRHTAAPLGDLTDLASPRTFSDTVHRDTNDKDYRRFTLTDRRTMRFELSASHRGCGPVFGRFIR